MPPLSSVPFRRTMRAETEAETAKYDNRESRLLRGIIGKGVRSTPLRYYPAGAAALIFFTKGHHMPDEIHSFSDFADARMALAGKKVRMEQILNKHITVRGHKVIASKRNSGANCLYLQFEMDGELCILFTGSAVLIDQCEKYAEQIPFQTTIIQIDKYFTFS